MKYIWKLLFLISLCINAFYVATLIKSKDGYKVFSNKEDSIEQESPLQEYRTEWRYDKELAELKQKYQKIQDSVNAALATENNFTPQDGPGEITGWNGQIIKIEWDVDFKQTPTYAAKHERHIPLSSIVAIDSVKKLIGEYHAIVYYNGPLGQIEYCILLDAELEGGGKMYERLIDKWKYSQMHD